LQSGGTRGVPDTQETSVGSGIDSILHIHYTSV
jgi:hypothetical protein